MFLSLRPRPLALWLLRLTPLLAPSPLPACGPSFYAAAPALIAGEMPLSVKTLADLYDRAVTPDLPPEQSAAIRVERITAAAEAMKLPAAEARARLDSLLAENRKSGWQAAVANLLWDLRDTLDSAPNPSPERERWIAWRLARVTDIKVTTIQRPVALNASQAWKELAEAREAARAKRDAEAEKELETLRAAGMDGAPPSLQPHWRVQAGAVWFRHWNFAKALEEFEAVARDFPDHPRTETAAFMALRCRIELARDAVGEWHQREDQQAGNQSREVRAASEACEQFSEKYGTGRFAADLPGWRGALELINGNWISAFCDYIEQADAPDQPELTRGALREAERCLRLAAENSSRAVNGFSLDPARTLTAHPRAAVRFVYHLLEPAAAVNFEQWPWTSEQITGSDIVSFRRHTRWQIREEFRDLLPALARELERAGASAGGKDDWDPFALAVIAWAACEAGEYERVLSLCRHHPAQLEAGDDLQMVRAIALQRMGRPAEALRAWNRLAAAFPRSPLKAQAEKRIVRCLMEAGDPAAALAMLPPPPDRNFQTETREAAAEAERRAATEAIEGSLTAQWRDALALTAPLESLQKAFLTGQRAGAVPWFGQIIASRMAGRGEFVLAREFLNGTANPSPSTQNHDAWWNGNEPESEFPPGPFFPPAARWDEIFAAAAKALQTARESPRGEEGAKAWLGAGEAVGALRDKCAFDCSADDYMNSEYRQREFRVRRNARTLGYSADAVTDEILHQDPLALASECWAKAVDAAPDSPAAARALFLQNEALRFRAEYSPFAAAVADERDWTAESAKLVASLRAMTIPEAAPLAAAAVPWQFRDMPWLPGNIHQSYADEDLLKAMVPISEAEAAASSPLPQIAELARAAWHTGGTEAALRKLEELRALCCSAVLQDDPQRLPALRLTGDLRAAMSIANLTPGQRESCLDWISGASLEVLKNTSGWEDLVSYAELRDQDFSRYSPEQPAAWQLWISENPGSVRLEDASFQFLRAECRRHRGWTRFTNADWPDGPLTNSRYLMITVDREAPPAPEAVKALLDAFVQRWPNSRFASDVALLRGGAAIDRRDWSTALDQIIPLVEGRAHRELHMEAVHLTADLFLHLLESEDRPTLAEAIRARPDALRVLSRFMTSDTPGGRLLPFRDWLGLSSLRVPPPASDGDF